MTCHVICDYYFGGVACYGLCVGFIKQESISNLNLNLLFTLLMHGHEMINFFSIQRITV